MKSSILGGTDKEPDEFSSATVGEFIHNPIEQVEGRDASNVDLSILLSLNYNEFQALTQELKSQRVIMIAFMEEIKQ